MFSIGQAAQLLGVSADTVRRWVDSGRLTAIRKGADAGHGGRRQIEGHELARFAQSLAPAPADETAGPSSARNRFAGLVTEVTKDGVMAKVDLVCGPHRVVSLMSREAADELGLQPGRLAVATVKATNVIVELPPS